MLTFSRKVRERLNSKLAAKRHTVELLVTHCCPHTKNVHHEIYTALAKRPAPCDVHRESVKTADEVKHKNGKYFPREAFSCLNAASPSKNERLEIARRVLTSKSLVTFCRSLGFRSLHRCTRLSVDFPLSARSKFGFTHYSCLLGYF